MKLIKNIGLALFILALTIFVASLTLSNHTLTETVLSENISNQYHREMIQQQAGDLIGKEFGSNIAFINAMKPVLNNSLDALDKSVGVDPANGVWNAIPEKLPQGVEDESKYRMYPNTVDDYLFTLTKYSAGGLLPGNSMLFFLLSFILAALGGLMYLLPDLNLIPGIKNNQIYDSPATRGITFKSRMVFLGMTILASILMIKFKDVFTGILTVLAGIFIIYRIRKTNKDNNVSFEKTRKVSAPKGLGWIGISFGIFLILFYVALYLFYIY